MPTDKSCEYCIEKFPDDTQKSGLLRKKFLQIKKVRPSQGKIILTESGKQFIECLEKMLAVSDDEIRANM